MTDPIGEGKKLYSSGKLRGVWPAGELDARLKALEACRKSVSAKRKSVWFWLLASVVAAIVFAVLRSSLSHEGADPGLFSSFCFIALFACILSAVIAIVVLIQSGLKKYDEDATAVLGPLIRCLGPDLAPGASFKVSASLKPPTATDLRVRTGETYSTANYPNCVDNFFQREILDLGCLLRDGTRLLIGIAEQTTEKVLRKKNPRGKTKTKVKCRRKITIKVRLLLDENRCRLTGAIRLPKGASLRVARHPRGARVSLALRKDLTGKERLDVGPLLTALAGVYEAVTIVSQNDPILPGGIQ